MSQSTGNGQTESISRYEIMSELGSGGMGVVYKAIDPYLKKVFALKVLNTKNVSDDMKVRFQKEAKALKDLRHNAIPEVFNFGISKNDEPYMVMEFVEGRSLQQVLEEHQKLPATQTIEIVEQICDALAYAHAHKILHRDIKPANIIIEPTFNEDRANIKVIDFGLAKLEKNENEEQDMTKSGLVIGSPPYMSPEQITGQIIDRRSDIYSLGCVLFELLAGKRPFIGRNALETISMHINNPPPSLCELEGESNINRKLDSILSKCLEKERENRFQSMQDLKEALEEITKDESISSDDLLSDIESDASIPIGKIFKVPVDTVSLEKQSITQELFEKEENEPSSHNSESNAPANRKLLFIGISLVILIAGFSAFYISTHKPTKEHKEQTAAIKKAKLKNASTVQDGVPYDPNQMLKLDTFVLKKGGFGDPKLNTSGNSFRVFNRNENRVAVGNQKTNDANLALAVKRYKNCDFWNLAHSNITSNGLKHLLNCKKDIKGLVLSSTKIDSKAIPIIKQMKELRTLAIAGCNELTDADIENLSKFPFRYLAIGGKQLTNESIHSIGKMNSLKSLTLIGLKPLPKDIDSLINLEHLFKLELRNVPLTEEICSQFAKIPNLEILIFGHYSWSIKSEYIKGFKKAKNLQTMIVLNSSITNSALSELGKYRQLRKLDLETAKIEKGAEPVINNLSKQLPKCEVVSPISISHKLPKLRK